jgi:hypothetical protein
VVPESGGRALEKLSMAGWDNFVTALPVVVEFFDDHTLREQLVFMTPR